TETEGHYVLARLERERKLAVLLDLKLGHESGVDVLREIRAKYPSMPVVVLTGFRDEMTGPLEMASRIGAHTCLYKPLEIDGMLKVLDDIKLSKAKDYLDAAVSA
ncbi:MAG: response regulator, partial [Candidatus Eremiobacteraeota bacterium]|nr:response regulator [Candidatus Eremiobacteraeota bacterium]